MSEELKCPICGKNTYSCFGNPRKDKLCAEHGKMLHEGKITYNELFGEYYDLKGNLIETIYTKKENLIHKQTTETICVICGAESNGKPQCKNCYHETKEFMEVLDRNNSVRKTRDYYYNLKERIFIIKSLEETQKQCNKLIAIAMVAEQYNDDTSLIDRVYKDVETLIKNKQAPLPNDKFEEERKEKDENKSKLNRAQDGHELDSDMEVRIDDTLFNAMILHACGKSIDEITETRKKCDWYIPITGNEGIYIEYWGMKTPKYLEERKEKEELYKKYDIPYIGIEQDDPKKDTQTFKSNLLRDLTALAIKRFNFMPKWKK